MKAMDLPAFRFSLSWSRIIRADGSVNPLGIAHYNALINGLLAADVIPYVTLYHWDLPTAYSSYVLGPAGDWLNSSYIVPLFTHYADVVFAAFGDRVKNWSAALHNHYSAQCTPACASLTVLCPALCGAG